MHNNKIGEKAKLSRKTKYGH